MFLFPLIYISSFFLSAKELIKGNKQGILIFLVFGLPIYITTLSILMDMGMRDLIPLFQPFKELLVLGLLGVSVYCMRTRLRLHTIDYAVIAFFSYSLLYVVLPIGEYGLKDKLLAFKSTSFFPLIYFTGRLLHPALIYVNRLFSYILIVAIAAGVLVLFESLAGTHFQTFTGYADYNYYLFNQEPTGNFGLSWTFETETQLKRYASFFANPLEHAASTLLALASIAALYTYDNNRFRPNLLGKIALAATFVSIILAISRASMLSYFVMIYMYALVTRKRYIFHLFHAGAALVVLYFIYLVRNEDIYDFVIETLTFQNASSAGHVLEWIAGIQAIAENPLGLGLGASGKISGMTGTNVGGENEFIILGVQVGIVGLLLYLFIHLSIVFTAWKWLRHLKGKDRKIAMALFLIKIGSILPLLTANFESYLYVSYMIWFLSGFFVNIVMIRSLAAKQNQSPATAEP